MKSIPFSPLALLAASMLPGLAVAAPCQEPSVVALRNSLVAQNTANIQRVISTRNCALIPSTLAFTRRANQLVDQAMRNTHGRCSPGTAQLSLAALEADLRSKCDHGSAKTTVAATAPTTPAKTEPRPLKTAPRSAARIAATANGGCNQSTITDTKNAQTPSASTPCPTTKPVASAEPPKRKPSTSPPIGSSASNGAAAIDSLRTLVPELAKLIDDADSQVNGPNIPPPSEWRTPPAEAPAATPHRTADATASSADCCDTPLAEPPSDRKLGLTPQSGTPPEAAPQEEDDYAAICRSESVKNGLKSLKQDLEAAKKGGRYGIKFFREKLKLQWATLKKCIKDPMDKAIVERLEKDPIILNEDQ